jgi:hypothetical protein
MCCARQSLHPLPRFASVLHLAATLCFRTKHSAQEPNDEEQGVPEYGAATL